jgi:hypothetical protein
MPIDHELLIPRNREPQLYTGSEPGASTVCMSKRQCHRVASLLMNRYQPRNRRKAFIRVFGVSKALPRIAVGNLAHLLDWTQNGKCKSVIGDEL